VSAVRRLAVCDAARAHALCRFLLKGERETSRDGARHHLRVDAPRSLRPRGGVAPVLAGAQGPIAVTPSQLVWQPAVPGIEMAVISGDPGRKGGLSVIRLRTKRSFDGEWSHLRCHRGRQRQLHGLAIRRAALGSPEVDWYQAERELERPSRVMPTMLRRALEPDWSDSCAELGR